MMNPDIKQVGRPVPLIPERTASQPPSGSKEMTQFGLLDKVKKVGNISM